jgi:hypothetical protein
MDYVELKNSETDVSTSSSHSLQRELRRGRRKNRKRIPKRYSKKSNTIATGTGERVSPLEDCSDVLSISIRQFESGLIHSSERFSGNLTGTGTLIFQDEMEKNPK